MIVRVKPIAAAVFILLAVASVFRIVVQRSLHTNHNRSKTPVSSSTDYSLQYTERNVTFRMAGVPTTAERYDPISAGTHPAVILLYGSGGMKGAEPAYRWYAESLADSGMVTLI